LFIWYTNPRSDQAKDPHDSSMEVCHEHLGRMTLLDLIRLCFPVMGVF
jgi:hypothetical protein